MAEDSELYNKKAVTLLVTALFWLYPNKKYVSLRILHHFCERLYVFCMYLASHASSR